MGQYGSNRLTVEFYKKIGSGSDFFGRLIFDIFIVKVLKDFPYENGHFVKEFSNFL